MESNNQQATTSEKVRLAIGGALVFIGVVIAVLGNQAADHSRLVAIFSGEQNPGFQPGTGVMIFGIVLAFAGFGVLSESLTRISKRH